MDYKPALLISILLYLFPFTIFAQGENNVWVFGYHNGLDFSSDTPVFRETAIELHLGSAAIADANGQLLFYTNRRTIWDADNHPMPNGGGLRGYPLSGSRWEANPFDQAVTILRSVSDNTKYFVFVLETFDQANKGNLYYHIVDMSLNGGRGDLIRKNVVLDSAMSDGMVLAKGTDCTTYWLIGYKNSGSTYCAYKIDAAGIHPPVYSPGAGVALASGLFLSHDGLKLASISGNYYEDGSDSLFIILSAFDPATGMVSDPTLIHGAFPEDAAYYHYYTGLCFSPDSRLLYAIMQRGVKGPLPSSLDFYLHQYNISAFPDGNMISGTMKLIDNNNLGWSMRLGPDQKIYVYEPWTGFIGCIQDPDAEGASCDLDMKYLPQPSYARFPDIIRGDYYGYYFGSPAVIQPEITVSSRPVADYLLCLGDTVKISVAGSYSQYQWDDGSVDPVRNFTKEGMYWVYKIKDCHIDIDSFNVITPKAGIRENDTLLCRLQSAEITLHAQSDIPGSYAWNTGATGDSITVDQSGLYIFTQTNECGVFSDSVDVVFNEQCDCRPFIPDAFSPNGDGLNDVLGVRNICQTSVYFMSIYNRYGQRIFFSDNIDESWDGTWKGKQVAAGTYYYILNYEALGKIRFLLKGDVILIR